jgi:hypothetical protein
VRTGDQVERRSLLLTVLAIGLTISSLLSIELSLVVASAVWQKNLAYVAALSPPVFWILSHSVRLSEYWAVAVVVIYLAAATVAIRMKTGLLRSVLVLGALWLALGIAAGVIMLAAAVPYRVCCF